MTHPSPATSVRIFARVFAPAGAPLGRRARPEEISPLVVYLASKASSYVTGADFLIDGGVTIR
jgi:NAD(P)-dependent dehydrogenase (short-subunit alcohol dehydrogenase family)